MIGKRATIKMFLIYRKVVTSNMETNSVRKGVGEIEANPEKCARNLEAKIEKSNRKHVNCPHL